MARHYNSAFGERTRWDIGAHTAQTSSNFTYVVIFQRTDDTTFDVLSSFVSSDGTDRFWYQIEDTDGFTTTGNSMSGQTSGFTVTSDDGWVLLAVTKPSGTSTPILHKYRYDTDAWIHETPEIITRNPYFEHNDDGWDALATTISVSEDIEAPNGAPTTLKVVPDGTSSVGGVDSELTGVGTISVGTTYKAHAQVYSPGGWNTWRINILWFNAAGSLLSTTFGSTTNIPAADWTDLDVSGTAPANASQATVAIRHQNTPDTDDVLYVYEARLDPNTTPTQATGTAAGADGWIDTGLLGGFNSPDGYFAAMATFPDDLTDAQVESLPHDLHRWWSFDPLGLWLFDQQHRGQPIEDYSGQGADQIDEVNPSVALIAAPISYSHPLPSTRLLTADIIELGLASETDTANTITAAKTVSLPLIEEVGVAPAFTVFTSRRVVLGLAEETDYAAPFGRQLSLIEEVGVANMFTSRGSFGPVEETDQVFPINAAKGPPLGLVEEVDSTFGMTVDTTPVPFTVSVDWEGDGTWTADWNNVTSLALNDAGIECEYGRDGSRALSPTATGTASLAIDNRSRTFSPENLNSPLAGNLGPARPIRVQAAYDGEVYTLFQGITDGYEVEPHQRKGVSKVNLTAVDALGQLSGALVTTQLWSGLRTDQAMNFLLNHLDWPSQELNLNPYFDDDIDGWVPSECTGVRSTEEVHPDGEASLKLSPDSDVVNFFGAGSFLFDVVEGREYVGSCYAFVPGGHHAIHVLVNWYNSGNNFITNKFGRATTVAPGEWTLVQDIFSPPIGAARAAVWVCGTQGPDVDQDYYFWNARLFDANDDAYRKLDVGASTMKWWWAEAEDAFEVAEQLVQAEGPPAFLHAGSSGEVVFRSRHHRLFDERSREAQTSFLPTGDVEFMELTYDHGYRDVVNSVSVQVSELAPSAESETVWEDESFRSIAANETLLLRITLDNPVVRPTLSYHEASGDVTAAEVRNLSGQTIIIAFTAGGSGAGISHIIVAAQPVTSHRDIDILREEAASIQKYGKQSLPHEVPWVGVHDAEAIGDIILGQRAERLPLVNLTLAAGPDIPNDNQLTQQYSTDLSDRVHVFEEETCLDHDFFVETISHSVGEAGKLVVTQFGMEKAAVLADNVFRFNDADHGFDKGVFAVTGLDEPTAIFVFDDADRGFNKGVFAT